MFSNSFMLRYRSEGIYTIPFILLFFVFGYTQLKLYIVKKGYFTDEQAIEFFKKCKESDFHSFNEDNFEKVKEIYFFIFGTD